MTSGDIIDALESDISAANLLLPYRRSCDIEVGVAAILPPLTRLSILIFTFPLLPVSLSLSLSLSSFLPSFLPPLLLLLLLRLSFARSPNGYLAEP